MSEVEVKQLENEILSNPQNFMEIISKVKDKKIEMHLRDFKNEYDDFIACSAFTLYGPY